MDEMRKIATAFRKISREGREKSAALATVIKVKGSAYRRSGARMLIHFDPAGIAETIGSISGGCLERDVVERAARICAAGASEIAVYDSRTKTDAIFGTQTGCGGAVEILIESLSNPDVFRYLNFLAECAEARTKGAAAAIIADNHHQNNGQSLSGQRLLLTANGGLSSELINNELRTDLRLALSGEFKAQTKSYPVDEISGATCEVFVEPIQPAPALVIFGAGDDAQPFALFASQAGWHTTVYDHRAAFINTERFPQADHLVLAHPDEIEKNLTFDARTFAVLMTHNYAHDREILKKLLPSPIRYIGCLGTKKRTNKMLLELSGDVSQPDYYEQLKKIYAPVGLDTGAETPEEIAVSILAELCAVLSNRTGGHLRNRRAKLVTESADDTFVANEHRKMTDQFFDNHKKAISRNQHYERLRN